MMRIDIVHMWMISHHENVLHVMLSDFFFCLQTCIFHNDINHGLPAISTLLCQSLSIQFSCNYHQISSVGFPCEHDWSVFSLCSGSDVDNHTLYTCVSLQSVLPKCVHAFAHPWMFCIHIYRTFANHHYLPCYMRVKIWRKQIFLVFTLLCFVNSVLDAVWIWYPFVPCFSKI